jgi:hypothetical protein
MHPAATTASAPLSSAHDRHSSGPTVKKTIRSIA